MNSLPIIANMDEYRSFFNQREKVLPIMQEICRKHDITYSNLEAAKSGSNIVFLVDRKLVIKLFSPLFQSEFPIEYGILEKMGNQLEVAVPQIIAKGEIENWPYFIMSFLNGYPLGKIWKEISFSNQREIIHQLGRIMSDLHSIPLHLFSHLEENWCAFLEKQMGGCVEHHKKLGIEEPFIYQLSELIEGEKERLKNLPYKPALLHADIVMNEHLLLGKIGEQWQITGLLDFADGMIGHFEYEFLAPCIFLKGDRLFLKALLLSYGYLQEELTINLQRRLFVLTLLHRFSNLPWMLKNLFPGEKITDLYELEMRMFPLC